MLRYVYKPSTIIIITGEMLVGPFRELFMDEKPIGLGSSTTYYMVWSVRQHINLFDNISICRSTQAQCAHSARKMLSYHLCSQIEIVDLLSVGHIVRFGWFLAKCKWSTIFCLNCLLMLKLERKSSPIFSIFIIICGYIIGVQVTEKERSETVLGAQRWAVQFCYSQKICRGILVIRCWTTSWKWSCNLIWEMQKPSSCFDEW